MKMELIAEKMAIYLKEKSNHPSSVAVLRYGIEGVLSTVVTTTLLMIAATLLGKAYAVCSIVIAFGILRLTTGGAHLSTGWSCSITSVLLFTTASFIPLNQVGSYSLATISLLILFWKPFYLEPHQSRRALQHQTAFRIFSLFWIAFGVFLSYNRLNLNFSLGLFLQMFTVTPPGVWMIHTMNRLFQRKEVNSQ